MKPPAGMSVEEWKAQIELSRRMTPSERLQRAFELSEEARQSDLRGFRERFPGADEREIFLRYARWNLGPELFRKAYGDALPEDDSSYRDRED